MYPCFTTCRFHAVLLEWRRWFRKRKYFDTLVRCILHLQQRGANVKGTRKHGHKVFKRGETRKVGCGAFNGCAFIVKDFWCVPWNCLARWKRCIVVLVMQARSIIRSQWVVSWLSVVGHHISGHVVISCHDTQLQQRAFAGNFGRLSSNPFLLPLDLR